VIPRMRPDKSLRAQSLARRWGLTPAGAYGLAAIRYPDRAAIIDERGALTFAEVHSRTDALARALRASAIDDRDTVAIMCRNHRGFIEATVACSKLGANIVYLDPAAAPSVIAKVIDREDPSTLIYDEEFSELLRPVGYGRQRLVAWRDADRHCRCAQLDELIAREGSVTLRPPDEGRGSTVMLAAPGPGTGEAGRRLPSSLEIRGAVLSRIPLRRREVTMIAAPMFRTWGFLHLILGLRLASTLVLIRNFDPHDVLATADEHGVTALAVLPEMLASIMELPEATTACYRNEALRVVAVPGRGLASDLAIPAMERFGDVLYNLHGTCTVRLADRWTRKAWRAGDPARLGGLPLGGGASGEYAAHRVPQA